MARKTKTYVSTHGRDNGKHFVITEMDAFTAEEWGTRALMGLARSGVPVPEDVMYTGMAGLAYFSLRSFMAMEFDDAKVLLDEMLACVQIIPDPSKPSLIRPMDKEDIEEPQTILSLRSEVFELHTGFSIAGWISTLVSRQGQPASDQSQQDTPTSPEASG